MLTLIGREIRDHLVYLVGLGLVGAILIAILIAAAFEGIQIEIVPPIIMLTLILGVGLCALGATQMYGDRVNRVSPLLATLAVTRNHILAARIVVGILAVLLALVPVIVASTILLRMFLPPLAFYGRMLVETSVTMILVGLACYSVGLLVGWTTSRAWLLGGCLLLLTVPISLVWIKGFGPDAMMLLLLFIGAALLQTWHTFTSASL